MERDGFDGLVFEVDEVRREEEEEKDERDHDVVVEAAALVGPPEVRAKGFEHGSGALLFGDDGLAVHVGNEDLGDFDGAVGLLVVFEDGEVGAADGEAAAVEGVEELGFFGSGAGGSGCWRGGPGSLRSWSRS